MYRPPVRPQRLIILIGLVLAIQLAGCAPQVQPITGSARDDVLAYSEPKSDGLLAGLNAKDYAAFSKDFDEAMLKAIPETQFVSLKQQFDSQLGAYVSRQVTDVSQQDQSVIVVYTAKFEQDDAVTVRVVFGAGEPHQVIGLWFNSPKLKS